MKLAQFYAGAVVVVLAVGLHLGYFNFDLRVVSNNATQVPGNDSSSIPLFNITYPNATDIANVTFNSLFGGNLSLNQILYAMFGSEPVWMVWTGMGFVMCCLALQGGPHYHPHYDWGPIHDYHPSSTTSTETDEEDDEEDVPEAKSLQAGGVEILKCPHCAAPLKFGSSSNTTCEYCGNEVRRKQD